MKLHTRQNQLQRLHMIKANIADESIRRRLTKYAEIQMQTIILLYQKYILAKEVMKMFIIRSLLSEGSFYHNQVFYLQRNGRIKTYSKICYT